MTTWEKIVEAIPRFQDSEGEVLGVWSTDDEIICRTEPMANLIADILDCIGYDAMTGYYDPDEDKRMSEEDGLTGYYYVSV